MSLKPEVERERHWIDAIREGDERAFEELFHCFYADLCAYAETLTHSEAKTRDVVQDVFLKLWKGRKRLDVRTRLAPYLYRAVRNQALTHLQRRRDHVRIDADGSHWRIDASADDELHCEELERAYRCAVAALPERRRTAFVLHREHGITCGEIAEIMGISKRTVETHIGMALADLRERLQEFLQEQIRGR